MVIFNVFCYSRSECESDLWQGAFTTKDKAEEGEDISYYGVEPYTLDSE